MASATAHLQQAEHDEAFLSTLDLSTPVYLDWAVTVIFYAALHYIRAVAARHFFTSVSSYGDMDRLFERVAALKAHSALYHDYRQLKDDSRAARYDMRRFSADEVTDLRDGELRRIRTVARALASR